MNKKYLIVIIAIAIAAIVFSIVFFMFFGSQVPSPQTGTGSLPTASENVASSSLNNAFTSSTNGLLQASGTGSGFVPSPTTPSLRAKPVIITAKTTSGGTKVFSVTPIKSDSYGDILLANPEPYDILYFPGGSFDIALWDPNISLARQQAESAFLALLRIDKQTACTLKVNLGVPYNVNAAAAGFNYGLSFCPGSHPLPQ